MMKWLGRLVLVLVLAVGGFAAYVNFRPWPHFTPEKVELKVQSTPEKVARGKKWAQLLCAECHMNRQTGRLSGADMQASEFGDIWSLNITQHPTKGIGAWSDGEIMFLLRTGIARDGRYTPPWMAKLPHMADDDVESIIAFLRSDDPMVQASDVQNHVNTPSFLSKFLGTVAFGPLPYPKAPVPLPNTSDQVAWGKYLLFNTDCWTCHSEDFKKLNSLHPDQTPGYLGGGNPMPDGSGNIVTTSNLTPDDEHGIGKWTEAQFVKALRYGIRPDNTAVRLPMSAYTVFTEDEAKAIYAYLRTVPKIARPNAPRVTTPPPANADSGKKRYYQYGCNACHGEKGTGPLCDLTHNKENYPTEEALLSFIREPWKTHPETKMPSWGELIPDDELKTIAEYVRTLSVEPPAKPAEPPPAEAPKQE